MIKDEEEEEEKNKSKEVERGEEERNDEHFYNKTRNECFFFVQQIRTLCFITWQYPMISEIWTNNSRLFTQKEKCA